MAKRKKKRQKTLAPELALRILADGGLGMADDPSPRFLPRPRRVEGQPFAQVGRVRAGDSPRDLHLWVAMDNLRGAATTAVGCCGALLR